jgi:hypothetical protein
MKTTVVELIGAALGTLVCILPRLVYGATSPPIAITSVGLAAAAAGLAMFRPGVRWQSGAGVGIGLLILTVAQIMGDYSRDPTSHNLAPFEILGALVIGLPPAILGVLLGTLVGRKMPSPRLGGVVLVMLAVAIAAVSAKTTAADISRVEARALKKMVALAAAQHEFRTAHPLQGYTCDLGDLGEPFSSPIRRNHPSESYRLDGVVYRDGTAAVEGEYRYSVKCAGTRDPQELFVLTARAQPVGSRPLHVFCVGPDGAIRSIRSGRLYSCFAEGRIVQKVR